MYFSPDERQVLLGLRNVVSQRGGNWVYPTYRSDTLGWYEGVLTANLLLDGSPANIVGAIATDQDMFIQRTTSINVFCSTHRLGSRVQTALVGARLREQYGWRSKDLLHYVEDMLDLQNLPK